MSIIIRRWIRLLLWYSYASNRFHSSCAVARSFATRSCRFASAVSAHCAHFKAAVHHVGSSMPSSLLRNGRYSEMWIVDDCDIFPLDWVVVLPSSLHFLAFSLFLQHKPWQSYRGSTDTPLWPTSPSSGVHSFTFVIMEQRDCPDLKVIFMPNVWQTHPMSTFFVSAREHY